MIAIQQARVQVRLEHNQKLIILNHVARNQSTEAPTQEELRTAHCNKLVQPTAKEQAECHEIFTQDQQKLARDQDTKDPKRLKQCYFEPSYLCIPVIAEQDKSLRNKRERYLKDDYTIALFYSTSFIVVCNIAVEVVREIVRILRIVARGARQD